jgi:hypothetical protein
LQNIVYMNDMPKGLILVQGELVLIGTKKEEGEDQHERLY